MNKKKLVVIGMAGLLSCALWACEKENDSGRDGGEEKGVEASEVSKYYYEYEKQKIYITQDIEEAVGILGTGYEYFEAPSCASDGLDMFYYYQNLTLMANEISGKKVVTDIYFKNDTVSTPEGIKINSGYLDVVNQYGSDYEMNGTALEYVDGNTLFTVDINDGKVVSIEYEYK